MHFLCTVMLLVAILTLFSAGSGSGSGSEDYSTQATPPERPSHTAPKLTGSGSGPGSGSGIDERPGKTPEKHLPARELFSLFY
ncbi:uncharacterized protein LOC126834827 isoform X3 [Adelges cooleyi]|uniref:uncharacterized protein LOC126834827 isoform X3 n=1 Tax=Adelges cooleyi TaxID=133065 RepID=UPI00217F473D|nr:uncharacterized protein LOC126834827 isoform X3 [Adelges cooleyi]